MSGFPSKTESVERVDRLGDQFEAAFNRGDKPAIDAFLALAPESDRPQLLGALVGLDWELRTSAGESPGLDDYCRQFPHDVSVIEAAWEELSRSSGMRPGRVDPCAVQTLVNQTSETSVDPMRSVPPSTSSEQVPQTFGRFEIVRQLGKGAFGAVYLARDPKLDRNVALKVPHTAGFMDDTERQRFLREAKAAAGLSHPNICRVYEVSEADGQDFIVMEYVEGKPLHDYVARGKIQPKQAVQVVRKLALALEEAHRNGIVHRDIKPANVMINLRGEPILMDFGLARVQRTVDVALTQSGIIMGSPAYMSPEQARGAIDEIGPAADVYSLGVVLYELLCGKRPFAGSIAEVIGSILHVEPPPPSQHRPELDPNLVAICMKAIAKRAAERYPSMKDFAAVLGESLKEPGKAAATEAKPTAQPVPTTPAAVSDHQKNIQQFIQQGQLSAALEALKPLAVSPDAQLAAWAKEQTAKVQGEIKKWKEQLPTLAALGHKLIRKCDYAEARNILSQIPQGLRSTEIQQAIDEAQEKQEECDLLQVEVGEALRKERPKELPSLVKRFLQLKPGHKAMQKLAEELQQFGPDQAIRIRKGQRGGHSDSPLPWKWIATAVGGLAALFAIVYFAVIAFVTPYGTVIVQVESPDVIVSFENEAITVENSGKKYKLQPTDKKTLKVTVDGVEIDTGNNQITVSRNETKIITAKLLPDKQLELAIASETKTFAVPGKGTSAVASVTPNSSEPPRAIAPFDAAQAKAHQEAWAKYLGVPVEYENSIGMKFRLIPPGEFLMGITAEEIEAGLKIDPNNKLWQEIIKSEAPQHKVILTQPIYLSVNEVTQAEYEKVMGTNPSHFAPMGMGKEAVAGLETAEHPVETVSWNDAAEFCAKLSQQEKLKPFYVRAGETITPLDGTGYRLPSEAEWEFACRAGTATKYWIGDQDEDLVRAGWFGGNSGGRTHAAGELKANPFGLYDIHGNVLEWVQDGWDATFYGQFQEKPAINPNSPFSDGSQRVLRGGYWYNSAFHCRSSLRPAFDPSIRYLDFGFRVSLTVDAVKQALKRENAAAWHVWPADAPPPAIAPFDAEQAKQHQEAWAKYLGVPVEYTNSLGMKFRLIPPGEFMMGSTAAEIEAALKVLIEYKPWQECIKSEAPQHKVVLTQPIYLGVNEVTQAEYEKVMGVNPSAFAPMGTGKEAVAGLETADHPVEKVSWNDAAEFCAKLSKQEKLKPFYLRAGETITPLDGTGYRLPSEAEWEFACRAGTATKYWIGDQDEDLARAGWFSGNSGGRTHAAGELKANPFGLADIHGNAWEWVQDGWDATFYGQFQEKPAINPNSPFSDGSQRVVRGGGLVWTASRCRSSDRHADHPLARRGDIGFRVSLVATKPTDGPRPPVGAGPDAAPAVQPPAGRRGFDFNAWNSVSKQLADRKIHASLTGDAIDRTATRAFVVLKTSPSDGKIPDDLLAILLPLSHVTFNVDYLTDAGLQQLASLPGLTGIVHHSNDGRSIVTPEGIGHLKSCSNLKFLGLTGIPVSVEHVKVIAELPHVQQLYLSHTPLSDEMVRIVSELSGLRYLNVQTAGINDAHLAELAKLDKLEWLHLDGNPQVTDRGLNSLKSLKGLKNLTIGATNVSPEMIRMLSDFNGLRTLNVSSAGINDARVAELAKLEKLEGLALDFNPQVTDRGLNSLKILKGLKNLGIHGLKVSPEAIAELQSALPDCKISK